MNIDKVQDNPYTFTDRDIENLRTILIRHDDNIKDLWCRFEKTKIKPRFVDYFQGIATTVLAIATTVHIITLITTLIAR